MNDIKLQSLLNLHEIYRKRSVRLGILVYTLPLIYICVKFNLLSEIDLGFFKIDNSNILVVLAPAIYVLITSVFTITHIKSTEVINEIKVVAGAENGINKNWFGLLNLSNVINYVMKGFVKNYIVALFFMLPLILFVLLLPTFFSLYSLYNIFKQTLNEPSTFNIVVCIVTTWLIVGYGYLLSTSHNKQKVDHG
ncbi:hypothetical protein [Nonlabens ulvanivorans]|uniref:hypothetical protein n=1 Tax=Nonlabens ulvanivorans TaxID=906888 RepID=UPI003265E3E5